jgi:putative molybdenum carrier protein
LHTAPVLECVISGGQTGVDRAALDWAIARGISHGGWCPRGRRAADGAINERYALRETPSRDYSQRTRWNVRDADATLIISRRELLAGGSAYTREFCVKTGKPWLHVRPGADDAARIEAFLREHRVRVLNVAGPRESTEPGVYEYATEVLGKIGVRPRIPNSGSDPELA